MADLLLSALIPIVMRKSADSLVQKIGEMWGIDNQRERLHGKLLAVQAVLTDAEEKGHANQAVKSWLAKLKSAAYDADDVLDEFRYEELRRDAVRRGHKVGNVSGFFSLKNPVLFRYEMSRKLKEVVGRIDELVTQMETFKFDHDRERQVVNRVITHSYVSESEVVGRGDDKEKIVKLLTEVGPTDNLVILPIVGMGGLGKTTLAQLVYNDPRVKKYFNLPLWVCVADQDHEFNIGHLVKSIIELVEGKCDIPIKNMELLQRRLRKVLSGKRYVLVLDDVWNENEDKWKRLRDLLNCGDSGSVVIVTTRSDRVAKIMGTMESYNLGCLGEEDSWSLFHKRIFSKGVKECQKLVEIGKTMVQNCRGLPLAINALGSLMSCKFELREWLDVLKESRIWEQRSSKDSILPILKLSYNHLPSYMKQCFAFCAVFPKDFEMDKDILVQFWMANEFIPSDGSSSLEMKGNEIFNELAWRSFFQDVRRHCNSSGSSRDDFTFGCEEWEEGQRIKCKMHDMMHDLAQSIMGAACKSISELEPAQLNHPMNHVHHIFMNTDPLLNIYKAVDCFPSIRSLIGSYNYGPNYVKNMKLLKSNSIRILNLRVYHIEKFSITPGKMKHLRYLKLFSGDIKSLPEEITTLYLLQTLNLSGCWNLEKLPEGMRYMSSLRHLYICERCWKLRSMPEGLGQLNCLQILTTYIVGTDAGNGIRELNNLNNLHGQLHLYNLRNIKHVVDAREANLIAKKNLDNLALCWGIPNIQETDATEVMHCDPFEVLDALKPCNNLKVLQVNLYKGDKLPVWMTDYQMLENLIELYMFKCRECTEIPPVEKLPFLRILKLKHLDNLRHLCNSASPSAEGGEDARVAFPSLKCMVLSEMPELCNWYEGEVGCKSSVIFPELKRLEVTNCPKLTVMPILPSLRIMFVKGNKNLSCVATGLTTLQELSLGSHGGNESISFQPWESLNDLSLKNFNRIIPVGAKEGEVSITPTKCRTLSCSNVSNITSSNSLWFWNYFTFLETLWIKKCDSLIYWPVEVFRSLNCLREIFVRDCLNFLGSQLESPVGSSITKMLLPILQGLRIFGCPNLVEIPKCSTSIQSLRIVRCQKLQSLPEWLGSMNALKELKIRDCESLNSLPLSIGGLANLETLTIESCPSLEYLPEEMQGLKALKDLRIMCPNIRVLPEGMQELKALENLRIKGCRKIRVLPVGMQGLKALEILEIEECPQIRILPEGLLQQLKNLHKLWISGCPHLERHFRMFGKYQHLISENGLIHIGGERRSGILKDLALSFPSCNITCLSAGS